MLMTHWHYGCCSVLLTLNKAFFTVSCSASQLMHKNLEESTTRTSGLPWPGGYSTPQSVMLPLYTGVSWLGAAIAVQGWTGWWSVGGEQLCCVSLVFLGFYSSLLLSFSLQLLLVVVMYFTLLSLLNQFYLNLWCFTFSLLFFVLHWGDERDW